MDIRTGYVPANENFISDWGERNFGSKDGLAIDPIDKDEVATDDGIVPCGNSYPPCQTNDGTVQTNNELGSNLLNLPGDSRLSKGGNQKAIVYVLIVVAVFLMAYVLYLAFKKNAKK